MLFSSGWKGEGGCQVEKEGGRENSRSVQMRRHQLAVRLVVSAISKATGILGDW